MSAKRWVGGVTKWQFLLIFTAIYAEVSWWAQKKPKTCWHNIWMVNMDRVIHNKFCIFLSNKKWAHFRRYVEAFKNLESNANKPTKKSVKPGPFTWNFFMIYFSNESHILDMSGMFSIKFFDSLLFPWIFSEVSCLC